jgi:membrane associated rhomboid family serine protease
VFFFPYSTDAPIYHLPFATGAFVLSNIAIFFATTLQVLLGNMDVESIEWLILQFNQINPLQWITGSFMHADPIHLLSNMFFLWTFGLVIEGKIGTIAFATLYMVMTLIDGAIIQVPMFFLGGESGAQGASGVIFALMTIAIIWAPENEMDCFYWFLFRPGTVEVRIIALGAAFIFLQIVFLYIGGFGMSSPMLHMAGVLIGLPIGFAMLRQGLVDCEGWDIVSRTDTLRNMNLFRSEKQRAAERQNESVIENPVEVALGTAAKKNRRGVQQRAAASKPATKQRKRSQTESASATADAHPEFNRLSFVFRQAIESKNHVTAAQAYRQMQQLNLTSAVSERLLFQYATLLGSTGHQVDALHPLNLVAGRQGPLADNARLRIGLVQLRVLKDREAAIESLDMIVDSPQLKPELRKKRDAVLAEARNA